MSVQRIKDLDITNKGLFVGLYGISGQEFYLDSDLRKYNFYQQLSMYLKEEGYDKVIMYDAVNNFHSYFKTDLEQLKYSTKKTNETEKRKSRVKNAIGRRRKSKAQTQENENSSLAFHKTGDKRNGFFKDLMDTRIIDYFSREINNSITKTVFIIKDFNNLNNDQQDTYITLFREAELNYIINSSQNKVIIIYDAKTSESLVEQFHQNRSKLIYNKFFEEIFSGTNEETNGINKDTTFEIEKPNIDEIRNLINHLRVVGEKSVEIMDSISITGSLYAKKYSLLKLHRILFEAESIGIEQLKNDKVIEDYKNNIEHKAIAKLIQKIKGQEDNSKIIIEQIALWNNLYKGQSPLNIFLVGASGVGKTYTTKVVGSSLKSNGFGYELIALSEFKSESERMNLFGAPAGYLGNDATPRLLESIRKYNGKLVICFDEVEEAHPQIMSSLVNLLEEGTIAFNVKGRTIIEDFSECIIFFTSNTAMEKLVEYKNDFVSNGGNINSEIFKQKVFEHLNEEELLHKKLQRRIEKFLVYSTLPPKAIIEIAYGEISKVLKLRKLTLNCCAPSYLSKIAVNALNQISGIDSIEGAIKSEIAPIILRSEFEENSLISLNYHDNIISLKKNTEDSNSYNENIEKALESFLQQSENLGIN